MQSTDTLVLRIYYLGDHDWTPLSQNPHWSRSTIGISSRRRMCQSPRSLNRMFCIFSQKERNILELIQLGLPDPGWMFWIHTGTVSADSCPHATIRWGWSRASRFGCFLLFEVDLALVTSNSYVGPEHTRKVPNRSDQRLPYRKPSQKTVLPRSYTPPRSCCHPL